MKNEIAEAFRRLKLPLPLRKYQWEGVNFLTSCEFGLLADEMGLGKTIQVAVALEVLYKMKKVDRTLIVVPAPLKLNWENEIKLWAPSLTLRKTIGGKLNRWAIFHSPVNVIIASYEDVRILYAQNNIDEIYDLVVLDEAQRIKNPRSNTTTMCRLIDRHSSWVLTGTPIENKLDDLVSLFNFMQFGFIDIYMTKFQIHNRIKKYFLRRVKSNVLKDMPPIIDQEIPLELTPKQRMAYQYYISSNHQYYNPNISTTKLLSIVTKLKQICNFDQESQESIKFEFLKTILSDLKTSQRKMIIFSQYVKTLEWIRSKLSDIYCEIYSGQLNEQNKTLVLENFKNIIGPAILLISIKAGGVGLNIQEADLVVLFDRWWNPAIEKQAINRAHRFGRKSTLHVIKFLVVDSIEEHILKILKKKDAIFKNYVDEAESSSLSIIKDEILSYLKTMSVQQ